MTPQERNQHGARKPGEATPKATLFCMDCGYSGHPRHGWRQRPSGTIVCPACGREVAERSRPHGEWVAGSRIVEAWAELVVASSMLGPRIVGNWCAGREPAGSGTVTVEDDQP